MMNRSNIRRNHVAPRVSGARMTIGTRASRVSQAGATSGACMQRLIQTRQANTHSPVLVHASATAGIPRATSGFTLVEILLALAITVVFTAIVCAGIPAAWRTYTDSVDASNAQVLLSTTTTTLRNELNCATNVETPDTAAATPSKITFDTGDGYQVTLDGSKNGIEKVTAAYTVDGDGKRVPGTSSSPTYLLTDATRTESLRITFANISFDEKYGVFSISGLEVKRGDDVIATVGTSDGTFKVKAISPEVRNDD